MKAEATNMDKEISAHISELAQRKAELEIEVETLNKSKEKIDFLIQENLIRIAEIDKLFS